MNSLNKQIAQEYGRFIQQFDWKYFVTCRSPYSITTTTVNRWCDKLFNANLSVTRIFWAMERDKGDASNKHVHMLIEAILDLNYKQIRKGLGNIPVGDFQEIYDKPLVCGYTTKFITYQGIEYNYLESKS